MPGSVARKVVDIGDDRFAVDSNCKIYRNGYGLTPVGTYLFYMDKGKRKKVLRDVLILLLHEQGVNPVEAVRRCKIVTQYNLLSPLQKALKMRGARTAKSRSVYCTTKRRKFKTMTEAAIFANVALPSLFQAMNEDREIKGLRFKFIN